jgi:hypothetical protein
MRKDPPTIAIKTIAATLVLVFEAVMLELQINEVLRLPVVEHGDDDDDGCVERSPDDGAVGQPAIEGPPDEQRGTVE